MHHSRVAVEIGVLCGNTNGLMDCRWGILACLPGARSAKQKIDVAQQPDRSLFGAVLHSNSIASSIGEKEFHRLVGLRDSRGAVEGYASRLYVDLLCGHIVSIFFARRVLRGARVHAAEDWRTTRSERDDGCTGELGELTACMICAMVG